MADREDQKSQVKNRPAAGDGTQEERDPTPQANWYGKTLEPQEEFIGDGVRTRDPASEGVSITGMPDQPQRPSEREELFDEDIVSEKRGGSENDLESRNPNR